MDGEHRVTERLAAESPRGARSRASPPQDCQTEIAGAEDVNLTAFRPDMEIDSAMRRATNTLGYSKLRPQLKTAVKSFVLGRDVFVSLPTGSGKYCLLPSVFDLLSGSDGTSIVVVVSPLISLMKDQVRSMMARNVRAVYVGDCLEEEEMDVCLGKYQLLYMSPEALITDERCMERHAVKPSVQ